MSLSLFYNYDEARRLYNEDPDILKHNPELLIDSLKYFYPNIDLEQDARIFGRAVAERRNERRNQKFLEFINFLIQTDQIDLNYQDSFGNTALMYAALRDNRDAVELLLRSGANPDLENNNGKTYIDAMGRNERDFDEPIRVKRASKSRKVRKVSRKASRKSRKASRKSRKVSRKSRKASRKSRKVSRKASRKSRKVSRKVRKSSGKSSRKSSGKVRK